MKTKIKKLDEIPHTLANDPSSSTIFTNVKKETKSFNQTNTSNLSEEQKKPKNNIEKSQIKKNKIIQINTSLRKNGSSTFPTKNPLISVSVPKRITSPKVDPIKMNSLLPVNVNPFQHLINGNVFGIFENLNWAFGLRNSGNLQLKGKNKAFGDKVNLTETFKEPSFYVDDLQKYKKKQKKRK